MSRSKIALLFFLSGLMLAASWYESLPSITIFIGFIPFLAAYEQLVLRKTRFWRIFWNVSITFSVWTLFSTWWIYNASPLGVVMAVIVSTIMMMLAFVPFHFTYKYLGRNIGLVSFIFYWITYEYFFHNTEVQWPWLTLGNGIGNDIKLIQWYEYTGVLGGSLWVLVINLFFYLMFCNYREKQNRKLINNGILLFAIIVVPVTISLIKFFSYKESSNPAKVLVVQPNIDPYNEKFTGMSNEDQMSIMINLALQDIDSTYDFVVCPETAIDDRIWEHEIRSNPSIIRLKSFVKQYPRVSWLTGMFSLKFYAAGDSIPFSAREYPYEKGVYYDRFNSAIQIDTSNNLPVYRKSKLVVGVEMMPYTQYMKFMEKSFIKLGAIRGKLGTQRDRGVFFSKNGKFGVGPVICYESVFGEFVSGYIKNGANFIFVLTNDGWWGDTPGYHQHFTFSQIRAIEMRRSIARSANTGISAIINQKGEVLDSLGWWKRGVITGEINANDKITFYANNGDFVGRFAFYLSILILIGAISFKIWKKP